MTTNPQPKELIDKTAWDYLRSRSNAPHCIYTAHGVWEIDVFITEDGFMVECLDRRDGEVTVTEYVPK